MANIAQVNYEDLARKANDMRAKAVEANKLVCDAYREMETMKKDWYGIRYNSLAQKSNSIIVDVNQLMDLIVKQIPYALETVANNYSLADRGQKICVAQPTEPIKLTEVTQSTSTEMKFVTTEVTGAQSRINSCFNSALSDVDTIESIFNSVTWQSTAADEFKSEFQRLKVKVKNSVGEIQNLLSQLIQQAINDVGSAETHNTVQ